MVSCYSQFLGIIRLAEQEPISSNGSLGIQNQSNEQSSPVDKICPLTTRGILVVLNPAAEQKIQCEPTSSGVIVGAKDRYSEGG